MKTDDVATILAYGRTLYPREFERLSAIWPPRIVMLKLLYNHTEEMVQIVKLCFMDSEEYYDACAYLDRCFEDVIR
jgi:hypothetical protein